MFINPQNNLMLFKVKLNWGSKERDGMRSL